MYKDVKKKLIALVLSICMVATVIEVVPIVKADANTETVISGLQVTGSNGDKNITLTYIGNQFTYTGEEIYPTIKSVMIDGTSTDIKEYCKFVTTDGKKPVTVGTYSVVLEAKTAADGVPNNPYRFTNKNLDKKYTYDIVQATAEKITVTRNNPSGILIVDGENVYPDLKTVTVEWESGTYTKDLNRNAEVEEYTVTPVTQANDNSKKTGTSGTFTVTLNDTKNFSNVVSATIMDCIVAYDLGNNYEYFVDFEEIGKTSFEYTGTSIAPKLYLYQKNSSTPVRIAELTSTDFDITLSGEKVTNGNAVEAGQYQITVKPKRNNRVSLNGELFTGTCTKTFTIAERNANNYLVVQCKNPDDPDSWLTITGDGATDLVLDYDDGKEVLPPDMRLVKKDNPTESGKVGFITVEKPNVSEAGLASLVIKPEAGSNYSGTITVPYFIRSALVVDQVKFGDYSIGKVNLPYTGEPWIPNRLVVKNKGTNAIELTENDDYEVRYNYQVNGQFIKANEITATQAQGSEYKAKMAAHGTKQILIYGKGNYATKDGSPAGMLEYTISPENMSSNTIELSADAFFYDGTSKKPTVTLKNSQGTVIPEGEYTVTYDNDTVNAGSHNVIVTAASGSNYVGQLSKTYAINPVSFDDAVIKESSFTYNGSPIIPTIVIKDTNHVQYGASYEYELVAGKDYNIVDTNGNTVLPSNLPANAGSYEIILKNNQNNLSNVTNPSTGQTKILSYTIQPKDIKTEGFRLLEVNGMGEIEWNAGEVKPGVEATSGLQLDVDYEVHYTGLYGQVTPDHSSGPAVKISGIGNYANDYLIYYKITPRALYRSEIVTTGSSVTYNESTNTYDLTLEILDKARGNYALSGTSDYSITKVEYSSDNGLTWSSSGSTAITGLNNAGYYKITVTGKNDYKETRTILLSCGKNLAVGYSVSIHNGPVEYRYDGNDHTPAAIDVSLRDPEGNIVSADCYTIEYVRTDGVKNNSHKTVGTIYAVAVGNPAKGYYGKTAISDDEDAFYKILPTIWKSDNYQIIIDTNGGIMYDPERDPNEIPDVTVRYQITPGVWITLEHNRDYTINWNEAGFDKTSLLSAGTKKVSVTGKGNHVGNKKDATYSVAPVSLDDCTLQKVESSSYADGNPAFTLVYKEHTLEQTVNVSQVKDFTCVISGSGLTWNESTKRYETTYILTGKGNYCGSIEVQVEVARTNLTSAEFADSAQEALPGQFYVEWNEAELLIKDANLQQTQRRQIKPEHFTVMYKPLGGGTPFALEKGVDYKISTENPYGKNNAPGYNNGANYVKISGINGYMGERQLPCLLYMDIEKATFASGSAISDGGTIRSDEFVEAYNAGNLDSLVKLLYDSGSGAQEVTDDNYDVTLVETSATGFGIKHLLIKGTKKDPYYFAGTKQITIQTTGNLDDAEVVINNNKPVYFKGIPITQPAISVRIGTKTLTQGVDFRIKTMPGIYNDTIGEGSITIEGLGDYSGTEKTKAFDIICSLSDVKIRMADEENIMQDWTTGTQFSYGYTDGTSDRPGVQPAVEVYLPNATGGKGAMLQLDGSYEVNYQNSDHAGVASIVITPIAGQFLDGSRTISYTIRQTDIMPITGGPISYSYNQRVTYTGNAVTSSVDGGLNLVIKDSNCMNQELVEGRDYEVVYQANNRTDVTSESRVTVNAKNGNYKGTFTFTFEIVPKDISAGDIIVNNDPIKMTYTGEGIVPTLDLKQTVGRQMTLVEDRDFEIVEYYDEGGHNRIADKTNPPAAPGIYYVGIQGIKNYQSRRQIKYEIVAQSIEQVKVEFVSTPHCIVDPRTNTPLCTYDATAHEPAVKVSYEGQELSTQDYIVTYTNNVNAGQATVTISANTSIERPKFSGSVDVNFEIKARSITEDLIDYQGITDGQEFPFDGNPVEPTVSITDKGLTGKPALVFLQDYDITYEDDNDDFNEHKYAGEVTMKITGIGNYEGEKIFTFYIGEDISKAYALYNGSSSVSTLYNGLIQAPDPTKITVEKNGTSIAQGTYDIAYYKDTISKETKVGLDQFIDAGTYYITVVGVPSKGTYAKTPSQNCTYNITPKTIAGCTVSGYAGMYYYTGSPIQPVGITVTDTDLPQGNQASDGKRSVELVQNRDFTISYQNNNSAGKATIVATGIGNYTGTVYAYFTIENSTINNSEEGDSTSQGSISKDGMTTLTPDNIILTYDDSSNNFMRYTGAEVLPTVSFVGGYNRSDFEITGVNNVNPGKATLVIRGKGGNYSGAIYMYFNIKANLSTHGQMSAVPDQAYTGAILTPHVTVGVGNNVLTLNQDYQLTYSNNQNVGKATITAQGVGDYYYGSISTTFNISNGAGGMSVSGYASSYIYSGNAIEPDVTVTMNGVTLTKNRDYTVTYANNVNVGTATMTVRGIGSYSGTQTINYTIEAKNIENCMSNAIANVKYTGNTYTPVVTLTDATTGKVLVQGSDYMITYSNNTNPGTASITITALSRNYVGTKVIPFKITSAAVTGLRTGTIKNNSIKLAWTSQSYADGYQICNAQNKVIATTANTSYTVKNLKSCTTYKYKVRSYVNNADGSTAYGDFSTAVSAKTLLNTPKLKAKSTKKGVVTLTWSKVSKATGYEIYYSTKRNGIYTKLKTVSSSSKRVYYDRGLATGEKYYYTIRAYRKVNGVKTYSNYNTIKAVTVK